ncbi:glycosyltransferase family 47 protein [Rhizobium sp. CSW-27]|uniref:glycosyltransferase family 47 protein n=1 Tax=Rhizobium sp. CSW-27 TaxID=2839985 RepID=UPI001C034BBC|nr:glycosyltransferase family 47 protein [Rhizobium sp. CSW-27]MBT9370084.1 glycosyltransferase family 47 protein [Rhizobium sp. CSW-27]
MAKRQGALEDLGLKARREAEMQMMTGRPKVAIDLPFDLLQTLRLAHAIAESGFTLCIRPEDAIKVRQLRRVFDLPVEVGTHDVPHLPSLYIDHLSPSTRIGTISRPIVMPQQIIHHCRVRWPIDRKMDVSFAGLLTESRRETINGWLAASGLQKIRLKERDMSLRGRIQRRVARMLHRGSGETIRTDNITIITSDQGRLFPLKSWNPGYYDVLLNSKYVLCPSGDFKARGIAWTYRFFESILCGAIPVIEEPCPAYEGFQYRKMGEPLGDLAWQAQAAEHNFQLARSRISVPVDEMRAEVLRLIEQAQPLQQVADYDNGIYAT